MADASSAITNQAVSFGLNNLLPSLMTLGPFTLGFGTVVALFMSMMGNSGPRLVIDQMGKVSQAADGSPVVVGQLGPFEQWVVNLYSGFIKLANFLADGELDINDLTLSMHFKKWSDGRWTVDISYAFDSEVVEYTNRVMYPGQRKWDSVALYWRIMRNALINNNSNLPAAIRTLLHDPSKSDKDAIEAAIAARKTELQARQADRESLLQRVKELVARQTELTRQQDSDLYRQELAYIDEQIAEARQALADSQAQTAAADQIAVEAQQTASKKTVSAAVPWLFFLGMMT